MVLYKLEAIYETRQNEGQRPVIVGLENDWHYNHMPKPFRRISWHRAEHIMRSKIPSFMEHRQISDLPGVKYARNVTIYYYSDQAIAEVHPSDWGLNAAGDLEWKEHTQWFLLGCDHKNVELNSQQCRELGITHHGMCWHVTKCSKCGKIDSYDSSG